MNMKEIQKVFSYQGSHLRTVVINNEPWFVATDVCKILDLSNPTIAVSRLDEDERSKFNLGRQGETNVVNEYGLYSLILASRKQEAKQFKRWITHEVIPSVRKHGAYMTPETIEKVLTDPDTIIKLATSLKEERAKRMEAEVLLEKQKPKVLFANAVETSNSSVLVGELAKIMKQNGVNIGQNRLFEWLRDNGYLIKSGESKNLPTQRSMEQGLFEIKKRTINNPDGYVRVTSTPKVTGKGQIYFVDKFLKMKSEV